MKRGKLIFILLSPVVGAMACGVRGRPQPPLTPAEIGHGQPTFKRSTGEDAFQNVPSPGSDARPEGTPTKARGWSAPSESN